MSKIQELIKSNDVIMVFDVDGVLAKMEYDEYNHIKYTEEEWDEAVRSGIKFYSSDDVIPRMQEYVKTKDINKMYACSKSYSPEENQLKTDFLKNNFNMLDDHIFFVRTNDEKLDVLRKIKENNQDIPDYHIAMVDDSNDVLSNIRDKSSFATIHISSFL